MQIEYTDKNNQRQVGEVVFKGFYNVDRPESYEVKHPTNMCLTVFVPVEEAKVVA